MLAFFAYVLLLTTLAVAQTMEPLAACSESTTSPACVLTFTPWAAGDIGGRSTYYQTIITEYLNIIPCSWCSVTNVENNPTPTGLFSERVTSPVLMVTRVACMTETTAVTRRDIRGYPEDATIEARTATGESVKAVAPEEDLRQDITARQGTAAEPAPPTWDVISAINDYRKQIYSAFMAVTLIFSGFDQHLMCNTLNDTNVQLSLSQQGLYPLQIKNLVCFSAEFGINFNASTFEVLDQLSSTATSLLLAVQNNLSQNALTLELCHDLTIDQSLYTMLKINRDGIYKVVCSAIGNATETITSAGSMVSTESASAGVSTGAFTFTSNGTLIVTGTAVGISWSTSGGTGAVSATLTEVGNVTNGVTATAEVSFGTALSTSWSAGSGSNASFSNATTVANGTGSAASANFTLAPTSIATATGGAMSWSFGTSGNASFGVSTSSGATGDGRPTPSFSWTTFTNANGSVIVSGTAAATIISGSAVPTGGGSSSSFGNSSGEASGTQFTATAVSTGGTATFTPVTGSATTVYSYSSMAWTSWVISNQATVAIITGTASSIEWGSAEATALITGSGRAATFTIYQITKTIIVTATGVAQTWSATAGGAAVTITASGTSGTWTLETQTLSGNASLSATDGPVPWNNTFATTATMIGSGSAASSLVGSALSTGSGIASAPGTDATVPWHNASTTSSAITSSGSVPLPANATETSAASSNSASTGLVNITISGAPFITQTVPPGAMNSSITGTPFSTGIPFVPANLTSTTGTITASGFDNASNSAVGSAATPWSGNTTFSFNATTFVGSGGFNVSTIVAGSITLSVPVSVGTGVVTMTNPVNGSNVTLSLSAPLVTTPKSFSYPGWTTSTMPAAVPQQP